MKKFLITSLILILSLNCVAFANETTDAPISAMTISDVDNGVETGIEPQLSIIDKVYTVYTSWTTLESDRNLLDATIRVTNSLENPGAVKFRIKTEKTSQLLCGEKTVEPGETVILGEIPAGSGRWNIQAKAEKRGEYHLSFEDQFSSH